MIKVIKIIEEGRPGHEMAELEARMEELVQKREQLREEQMKWERWEENRRNVRQVFALAREREREIREEERGAALESRRTERELEECEAAMDRLAGAAQMVAERRVQEWRWEIAERERGIAERRRAIEVSELEEAVRRSRWEAMREGRERAG